MKSNKQKNDSDYIQNKEYGEQASIDVEESVSDMSKGPAVTFFGKRSFNFLGGKKQRSRAVFLAY
jgi:hypothetical protein